MEIVFRKKQETEQDTGIDYTEIPVALTKSHWFCLAVSLTHTQFLSISSTLLSFCINRYIYLGKAGEGKDENKAQPLECFYQEMTHIISTPLHWPKQVARPHLTSGELESIILQFA